MNRCNAYLLLLALSALPGIASAGVELKNEDSQGYDITVKCPPDSAASTDTSISSSTTTNLGSGPCQVTLRDSGASATAADGGTITIKDGVPTAN